MLFSPKQVMFPRSTLGTIAMKQLGYCYQFTY